MNRPAEAAAARLRGLAVDPLNARLRLALGEDYLFAGRLPEALAAFERGAQLDPLHPITLGLGRTGTRSRFILATIRPFRSAGVQRAFG